VVLWRSGCFLVEVGVENVCLVILLPVLTALFCWNVLIWRERERGSALLMPSLEKSADRSTHPRLCTCSDRAGGIHIF